MRTTPLLVAVAAILAAACAPEGAAPAGTPPDVPTESLQPVRVAGVEPCSSLVTTAERGETASSLPATRLPCLTERGAVDVASLGGRPTLVNFWATWCGPCREEMPVLQAAYENPDNDVQFVGIDTRDHPRAAAEFLAEVKVTYPQLFDAKAAILAHTRVPGLPVTLLLDQDGAEVARHIGPLTDHELAALLDKA